jgi:A-macroglobulin receptor
VLVRKRRSKPCRLQNTGSNLLDEINMRQQGATRLGLWVQDAHLLVKLLTHDLDRFQKVRVVRNHDCHIKPAHMRIMQQMSGQVYIRSFFFRLDHHGVSLRLSRRYNDRHIAQKDRYGAWYSTQTTVNVIDALLLLASRETPGMQVPLQVAVNGASQALPANIAQTLSPQVLDISRLSHAGKNTIEISGGKGTLTSAQTVAAYYVQWTSALAAPKAGPLKLSVACDQTRLVLGVKVTCSVNAERIGSAGHGMMIAEIGIPPGVDVDREALQRQVSESGWDLSSFEVLPDRIVAYLWPKAGGTKFSLSFTPRMAIDAQAAPHTLFDYYNPDASVTIAPDRFIVREPSTASTH